MSVWPACLVVAGILARHGAMSSLSKGVISMKVFPRVKTGKIKYLERNVFAYFSHVSPSIFKMLSNQCYFNIFKELKFFFLLIHPQNSVSQVEKAPQQMAKGSKKGLLLTQLYRAFRLPRCSSQTSPCLNLTPTRQYRQYFAYFIGQDTQAQRGDEIT